MSRPVTDAEWEEYRLLALEYAHLLGRYLGSLTDGILPRLVTDRLRRVRVLSERNEWLAWEVHDATNGEGTRGTWMGYLPTVWEGSADLDDLREMLPELREATDARTR